MSSILTMEQFAQELQSEKKDRLLEALRLMKTELKAEDVNDTYNDMRDTLLDGGWG